MAIDVKATECSASVTIDIVCAPPPPRVLASCLFHPIVCYFLLTLSIYCQMQIVCMNFLIILLGIRHSLCKTPWTHLFYIFIPWTPSLKINLLVHVSEAQTNFSGWQFLWVSSHSISTRLILCKSVWDPLRHWSMLVALCLALHCLCSLKQIKTVGKQLSVESWEIIFPRKEHRNALCNTKCSALKN